MSAVLASRSTPRCAACSTTCRRRGSTSRELQPGRRVWVPFGRRRAVGVMVELRDHSDVPAEKLKARSALIDDEPVLDASAAGPAALVGRVLPPPARRGDRGGAARVALRTGSGAHESRAERWTLSAAARTGDADRWVSARQPPARTGRLPRRTRACRRRGTRRTLSPRWRDHVRELEKRGWVTRRARGRLAAADAAGAAPSRANWARNRRRNSARRSRRSIAAQGRFAPFLLHGVTGSGKTEVYLRAIERVRRARRSRRWCWCRRSRSRRSSSRASRAASPRRSRCCTPALTDTERLHAWRAARSGAAPIVIGTRSAVFAPLARPGLIVVDEEHDASYKQQEGLPLFRARPGAGARAAARGCPSCWARRRRRSRACERMRAGRAHAARRCRTGPAGARPPRAAPHRPARARRARRASPRRRCWPCSATSPRAGRCCCSSTAAATRRRCSAPAAAGSRPARAATRA